MIAAGQPPSVVKSRGQITLAHTRLQYKTGNAFASQLRHEPKYADIYLLIAATTVVAGAAADKRFLPQRLFCPCMILRRRSLSLSGDSADAAEDVEDAEGEEGCCCCGRVAGETPLCTCSEGREDEGVLVFGGGVDAGSLVWACICADSRARMASMAEV